MPPIVSGLNPFLSSTPHLGGAIGAEIACLDNPFGDQFIGMDPMELRHGVFAWNGQPITGGGNNASLKALGQSLFPRHGAPTDGNLIAQVAKNSDMNNYLQRGTVVAWTQSVEAEKIPYMFALCELPVSPDQVFDTLLDVNNLDTWMPRVMLFKSDDPDARDLGAMRRRFARHRSLHLEDIVSRYKSTVPHFYGRFAIDYRQLPGGALQMEWNVKGDQTLPEEPKKLGLETSKELKELKPMKTNNSSFTLIASPERPGNTVCAYHLNAQPVYFPFVASVVSLFVPNDNTNELDRLFQALLNRTLDRRWTAKGHGKDPLGLELFRVPSPTPHRFEVYKAY